MGPRRVVIVGGGVAGSRSRPRVPGSGRDVRSVTVIAPEPVFTPRALDLARPFAGGEAEQLDLEHFMSEHGGRIRRTAVVGVDAERRTLSCTTGPDERYDALVIAVGASARPAFDHAVTFGADFLACDELLADLEHERTRSVAFVVPRGLHLAVATLRAGPHDRRPGSRDELHEVHLHLVTPERGALDLFGTHAERRRHRVAAVSAHRPALRCGRGGPPRRARGHRARPNPGGGARRHARPPRRPAPPACPPMHTGSSRSTSTAVWPGPTPFAPPATRPTDRSSTADLPASRPTPSLPMSQLSPARRSTPSPIGPSCAGDCSPDLASASFGRDDTQLGDRGRPLWWPPARVSGRYLAPYLELHGLVALPLREHAGGAGVDVRLPLSRLGPGESPSPTLIA